jgi:hypothetical protein
MNSTIIINRRTPINLKDVSVIEPLTPGEIDKLAERYEGDWRRLPKPLYSVILSPFFTSLV